MTLMSTPARIRSPRPRRQALPSAAKRGDVVSTGWFSFWLPIALIVAAVGICYANPRFADFSDDAAIQIDLEAELSGSNPARLIIFPLLGLAGAVLLLGPNRRRIKIHPMLATAAVVLLLIVGASVLWSVDPLRSVKRAGIVYLVAVAAIGIGRTWTSHDLCRAALIISSLLVAASIACEIGLQTFLRGADYRFSGFFHPNQQAVNTGVMALSSLCLFGKSGRYRYLALAAVAILLTKLTGSRGCMLGLVLAVAAMYWVAASMAQRIATVIVCAMGLSVGLVFLALSDTRIPSVVEVARMGRVDENAQDEPLNGRLLMWDAVLDDIAERPLIGYGYGAFWSPDRVYEYSWIRGWAFSSAHSVYLETVLDIGLIGLIAACLVTLITGWRSLRVFSRDRDWGVLLIFSLICMGAVSGLVDVMFVRVGFVTILLAIGVAILALDAHSRSGAGVPVTGAAIPALGHRAAPPAPAVGEAVIRGGGG